MSNSIERYVIKYISGSKMNQEEMLDFNKAELSIGRVPGCDIQFDAVQDLIVSREHGKIVREGSDPPSFTIVDNHSRNGIFVNKSRVKGSAKLNPGDAVQLGDNGPAFVFDIYPRPHDMMAPTQTIEIPTSIRPTTVSATEQQVPPVAEPIKTGLGKQTVERMLVAERKKSFKTLVWIVGGLALILGLLGYTLFLKEKEPPKEQSLVKTPTQIAKENENSVVRIAVSWQLFDALTNDELWHEYMEIKSPDGQKMYAGLYIENDQKEIEPFLYHKRNHRLGLPIGVFGSTASGFVVSEDGFILTNRHVAAGWNTVYDFPMLPGLLVRYINGERHIVREVSPVEVNNWVPAETRMVDGSLVESGRVKGRNTDINVIFAGTSLRRPVESVTPSDNHDVALIKVEIPESQTKVNVKDNYSEVKPGQSVVVMGYPAVAPEQFVVRRSNDPFYSKSQIAPIATPTVTPGSIGRIVPPSSSYNKDETFTTFGDSYQLTINATGAGNSGGPLFDDEGNVIGIYYAGRTDRQGTQISFAVPIKYGLELMGRKKVSDDN